MNNKTKLLAFMKANKGPHRAAELSKALHSPMNIVSVVISRMVKRNEVNKMGTGRGSKYWVGKKEKKTYTFTLPDNLWRGWTHPITGVTPARLGLDRKLHLCDVWDEILADDTKAARRYL
jgi:hypothetical protein